MFVLPEAQSSDTCAPGSTIQRYLCSREHKHIVFVLPGAQSGDVCAFFLLLDLALSLMPALDTNTVCYRQQHAGGRAGHGGDACGRRALDGRRNTSADAGAAAAGGKGAAGAAGGASTKFGFPATSGPGGKPVILEEAGESGVGRKRRRQEEEASEVMAVAAAQQKEAREAEAVRQTGVIHSDSVALAEGQEKGGRGEGGWGMGAKVECRVSRVEGRGSCVLLFCLYLLSAYRRAGEVFVCGVCIRMYALCWCAFDFMHIA